MPFAGIAAWRWSLPRSARKSGSKGTFQAAVDEGVINGYRDGYLRKSTCHPFARTNYGNNAPAIVHIKLVPGDRVRLTVAPKGGGSENMSALKMFPPAVGKEGVKSSLSKRWSRQAPIPVRRLSLASASAATLKRWPFSPRKRCCGRSVPFIPIRNWPKWKRNCWNPSTAWHRPRGLWRHPYGLAVHIEAAPCHIASLPVAVNLNCHAARHKTVEI